MSKVYNTMEYNVNELINYLLLYRELILNGQYDPYYKNQAIELLDKISQLEELIQNNSSFATFDFENMKKRFVGVFHPDRFKIKLENIESSEEIFGKTLPAIRAGYAVRRQKHLGYRTGYAHCQEHRAAYGRQDHRREHVGGGDYLYHHRALYRAAG